MHSFEIKMLVEVTIIIFTKDMLCARCCVSTSERYYLIRPHSSHFIDEEVNPEKLGGWPQMSAKWHSWDENLTF